MAHFLAPDVTSQPAKKIHAGLNTVISQYTLNETASGSTTIAICALPGGAEIVDCRVRANHAAINAGAAPGAVRVYPTIAGTSIGNLIPTSTLTYVVSVTDGAAAAGLGVRLTSSANLIININGVNGTGTVSTVFTVFCSYLSDKDPD